MSLYDIANMPAARKSITILEIQIIPLDKERCLVRQSVIKNGGHYLRQFEIDEEMFVEDSESYRRISPSFKLEGHETLDDFSILPVKDSTKEISAFLASTKSLLLEGAAISL